MTKTECSAGSVCPVHGSVHGYVCPVHGRRALSLKNVRNYHVGYICDRPGCDRPLSLKRLDREQELTHG